MVVLLRVVAGVLLVAHGLVHLLYLAPDTPEFSLDRSWLVPSGARRPVAVALMVATVVAFVLLALAVWQVPGLVAAWPVLALVAAGVSLLLLVLFWDWHLVFGVVIDVLLIAGALLRPDWLADFMGGG